MDTNTRIRLFSPSMARTNYVPPKPRRALVDLLLTAVTLLMLVYLLAHVGPALDGVVAEVEAEQKAQAQLQREAWAAAAAQRQCGGEEATWIEVGPGVVDCYDKRGRRTARNMKVQP